MGNRTRRFAERLLARVRSRGVVAHLTLALALVALVTQYAGTLHHPRADARRGDGVYRPILAVQDGHMLYLHALTLVYDRDLDISDEIERFGRTSNEYKTADGRPYYPSAVGTTLLWAPVLGAAHVASAVANAFGADIPSHGYSYFHQRVVFATSPILAWLAAVLIFVVCRRRFGGRYAPLLAALATLFGTNLYYYAVERPDYGHALSAAVCAAFLAYWAVTLGRIERRRFAILGALLGACGLCRITDLTLAVVLVVEMGWHLVTGLREPGRKALVREAAIVSGIATAAAALAFFPQMIAWHYQAGTGLLELPPMDGFMSLGEPRISELLFSKMNGYFATHPLTYAGTLGLLLLPRKHRLLGLGLFAAVVIEIYINACAWDWHGTGSYGNRRMIAVSLAIGVGMCGLLHGANNLMRRVPRHLRLGVGVIVLLWFVVWNLCYAAPTRGRLRAAPAEICCDELPDVMQKIAEPVYEKYGNPFAFPANALFARRWDVEMTRWDQLVNNIYADKLSFDDYRLNRGRDTWHHWNLAGAGVMQPYLLRGYGPHQPYRATGAKKVSYLRWLIADSGEALVPLFLGGPHELEVAVYPNLAEGDPPVLIRIAFNGTVYYEGLLARGWTTASFTVPDEAIERGMNLLEIRGPPPTPNRTGPVDEGGLPPHYKGKPVSVAVGSARLRVPNPRR